MTHDEAMHAYTQLIRRWGTMWTARMNIPKADWDLIEQCHKVLSIDDKRRAIGLPPTRRPNTLIQEQYERAWAEKQRLK
jgi:hypothetical protein